MKNDLVGGWEMDNNNQGKIYAGNAVGESNITGTVSVRLESGISS